MLQHNNYGWASLVAHEAVLTSLIVAPSLMHLHCQGGGWSYCCESLHLVETKIWMENKYGW